MPAVFSPPPPLTGDEKKQLLTLREYLFGISRQLNTALQNLDESNFSPNSQARSVVGGSLGTAASASLNSTASALKSLIVKTADQVHSEIETVQHTLESSYVANSDFGTFQEHVAAQFTATPQYVAQEIDYNATISAINSALGVLEQYRVETSGYIRSGVVYYDGVTPIIGIAIGQNLSDTGATEEVDGTDYDVLDKKQFSVVLTAQKLSFYQWETEVAYLSNSRLYITNLTVTNGINLSDKWLLTGNDGFTAWWIGE